MTLGGRVSRAKQFMTFSVSVKPTKRNKKIISAYRLSLFFYQDNKMHIHPLSVAVQSNIQLQEKKSGTNRYLHFQQTACLTFLS